jgi:hypothetical protein
MKHIARVKYDKDYWLKFSTDFMPSTIIGEGKQDIQITLEDNSGKYLSDAICHYGSYGVDEGEWEIMSRDLPEDWGDSVMGHLTWKQVEEYFDKTIKRLSTEPTHSSQEGKEL